MEYVIAYIDVQLIISDGNFEDHLDKIKIVLYKLKKAVGFETNADKSFFARDNLDYVGFKITWQDIMPSPDEEHCVIVMNDDLYLLQSNWNFYVAILVCFSNWDSQM